MEKITIVNPKGQEVVADLISVFKINETNNEYVLYTFNQKDDNNKVKDYVSRLRIENGKSYFDTIVDDSEWEMVKKAIEDLKEGNA